MENTWNVLIKTLWIRESVMLNFAIGVGGPNSNRKPFPIFPNLSRFFILYNCKFKFFFFFKIVIDRVQNTRMYMQVKLRKISNCCEKKKHFFKNISLATLLINCKKLNMPKWQPKAMIWTHYSISEMKSPPPPSMHLYSYYTQSNLASNDI